jgi:uncharacterized protein (TIGR02145 family)
VLGACFVVGQWIRFQSLADISYEESQVQGVSIVVAAGEGVNVNLNTDTCDLNLFPLPTGFMSNCQIIVTIKTFNSGGYTVHLSSNDENSCLTHSDACLTGQDLATGSFIVPTTGDFGNPQALATNTWGFAIPESQVTRSATPTDTFDDTYTVNGVDVGDSHLTPDEQAFLAAKYAKLPVKNSPVKVRETTTDTTSGEDLNIFLAVKMNNALSAGDYTGSLLIAVEARGLQAPAPTVQSISPSSQNGLAAGQQVAITGTNFKYNGQDVVTSVTIGGEECTGVNITSDTTLTCSAPAQTTTGAKAVQVTTTGGQSGEDITYMYSSGVVNKIIVDDSNIQDVTPAMCTNATVFDGSNDAISLVKDSRDNHYYAIAKMPDDKCWMITNLAYGGDMDNNGNDFGNMEHYASGDGTSGWTTSATSIAYYVDPYVDSEYNGGGVKQFSSTVTPCASSYRTTISSVDYTECGYLYNWYAATASTGTADMTSGDAAASICPIGWRLPTGGDNGEFQHLYTTLGSVQSNLIGNSSIWRGSYAGYFRAGAGQYSYGLTHQTAYGYYWSATARNSTNSSNLYHSAFNVFPASSSAKHYGFAIRCIRQ